jgi:SAM-dependent methyltransferase
MDKSLLVKLFGFRATLLHGDTLVQDRWRWLKERLPETRDGETLIDIGCGTGAFTIGAARRGYLALGLSWDERNQTTATLRAELCRAPTARFEILDVRRLDERRDLYTQFDVAVCCENIEHILDDKKLVLDMARCLKPGGRLLLTTPYLHFRPISRPELGPNSKVEDGGHVRRGYTGAMLEELCRHAGLTVERVSYCSGYVSQKVTAVMRLFARIHPLLGWACVLPLRPLPYLLDWLVAPFIDRPYYSVCLEAYKPRFPT